MVRMVTIQPGTRMACLLALVAGLTQAACGSESTGFDLSGDMCSIPEESILSGQRKDGIPALSNPEMAAPGASGTEYLLDSDRVIGVLVGGEPLAIPLNIMWWHEVVNIDRSGASLAITHCPLTGSSLAFDRRAVGGDQFGVSGLLFQTNLIMYDRTGGEESLWPQMLRGARCGPANGTPLTMVPIVETTWAGWRTLHPDTRVVTSNTGHSRNYRSYPYGSYDVLTNDDLLFPVTGGVDTRRPPKERVLGIPDGTGGVAFPYGELAGLGNVAAVSTSVGGRPVVVLWNTERGGAMAFFAELDGSPVTLEVVGDEIVDTATGSVWRIDGVAESGPRAGRALEAVPEAFVAFWFAWPVFYPDVELWEG